MGKPMLEKKILKSMALTPGRYSHFMHSFPFKLPPPKLSDVFVKRESLFDNLFFFGKNNLYGDIKLGPVRVT